MYMYVQYFKIKECMVSIQTYLESSLALKDQADKILLKWSITTKDKIYLFL